MRKIDFPSPVSAASDLIEASGIVEPPVPLENLAGTDVRFDIVVEDLEEAGYLVDLGVHGAEIIVRAQDPFTRQRFTVAHELGHLVLARAVPAAMRPHERESPIEKWCDQFATELLMPRAFIQRDLAAGGRRGLIQAVLRCPARYQVSHQSFRIRLSELYAISLFELAVQPHSGDVAIAARFDSQRFDRRDVDSCLEYLISRWPIGPIQKVEYGRFEIRISPELRAAEGNGFLVAVLPPAGDG